MKKLFIKLISIIVVVSACTTQAEPSIIIIPSKCQINAGDEFPISLEGSNMPVNGEIKWSVTKGEINPSTGLNVIYTAPQETGSVIITASLETKETRFSTTLVCEVTEKVSAQTSTEEIFEEPTPTQSLNSTTDGIAITEIMAAPCDGVYGPNKNEYLELYNYGNVDVDVNGWWIAVGEGGRGTPDQISIWEKVVPGVSLGNNVITNSSVIPPKGFAVILSPKYYIDQDQTDLMPYIFPKGTVILTISNSEYLGSDVRGLLGNGIPFTTVVLYIGSDKVMDTVISTYGTPTYGSSSSDVADDQLDKFPYSISDCVSMERIIASDRDTISNWRKVEGGNPGMGSYTP